MAEISLHSYIPSVETYRLESSNAYVVDDLTQRACELSGITPVYRFVTSGPIFLHTVLVYPLREIRRFTLLQVSDGIVRS